MSVSGVVLFAHGARDPEWAAPVTAIAELVRSVIGAGRVEIAFLEFMSPTLDVAIARLQQRGMSRIDIHPVFLAAGGHLKRDVPRLLADIEAACPDLNLVLHAPVGEHADVQSAIAHALIVRSGGCDPS